MNRRIAAVGAALVLAVGLGACGDDDDDGDEATATTVAAAEYEEYCDATLDLETSGEPDIDFENLSPAQISEEVKKYANEELDPKVEKIKANVPDEIDADVQVLINAFDRVKASGDFEGEFGKPEVVAAENRVHAFDVENCGWETAAVTATEYAFQGVPATVKAGPTSFDMRNSGKEFHHLVLLKKKAGVTKTFQELVAAGEEEAEKSVDEVNALDPTEPGGTAYVVANLEAGDYAAICFLAVGTTNIEEEAEGPPHFTRGMLSEFKVS